MTHAGFAVLRPTGDEIAVAALRPAGACGDRGIATPRDITFDVSRQARDPRPLRGGDGLPAHHELLRVTLLGAAIESVHPGRASGSAAIRSDRHVGQVRTLVWRCQLGRNRRTRRNGRVAAADSARPSLINPDGNHS